MFNRIGLYYHTKREIHRFITVINQTIFPPIISSLLYLAIFHFVMGQSNSINNIDYLEFLIPGLIMMAMINSSFANSSSSVFISRWIRHFEHMLTIPLSYLELALGYVIGSMVRGFLVGLSILLVTIFFIPFSIHSLPILFLYFFIATFTFGSLGVLVALWAEHFEHLGIFNTFILTPLTMLGGVFYSINVLPSFAQDLTLYNPIFYLVDGFRYGVIGIQDGSISTGLLITITIALISFLSVVFLMKNGYKVKQ